jgi:hypothetical protein
VKLTELASTVVAVCIYRVPGAVTAAFIDDLCDLLDQLLLMNVRFVICGDFNASSDRLVHADVVDVLVRYNLKQYINVPTHDHGNTLDLLITLDSEIDMLSNVSVQTVCFSDHSLISCRVIISTTRTTNKSYSFRPIKNMDIAAFRRDILSSKLFDNSAVSVDDYADLFDAELCGF